jgi:hypothetical protein
VKSNKDVILVLNNAPSIYPGNYFNYFLISFKTNNNFIFILLVHNSGIREYRYSTSFEKFGILIDYIQYYADINKANKIGRLEWEIEYVASKTYNMKQLSPSDWAKVLDKIKDKDSKLWKNYLKYVTVSEH